MRHALGLTGIPCQIAFLIALPCLSAVLDLSAARIRTTSSQPSGGLEVLAEVLSAVTVEVYVPLVIGLVGIFSGVPRNPVKTHISLQFDKLFWMDAFCLFVFCWWCFCNTNNVRSGGSQSFEVLCTGMCFLLLVLGLLDLRSSREKSTQGEIEGLLPITKHCFVRNCLQWLLVDLLRTCHVSGSLCFSTKCDITFAQKILEHEQNAEQIKYDTCWPSKSNDLHLGIRLSHPLAGNAEVSSLILKFGWSTDAFQDSDSWNILKSNKNPHNP